MKTLILFLLIPSYVVTVQAGVQLPRQSLKPAKVNRATVRSTWAIQHNRMRLMSRAERAKAIRSSGGSAETEAAVEKALWWLTKKQKSDGHWDETQSKVAHTGLAILCYLSYGVVPDDKRPEMKDHAAALSKGLKWLVHQVGEDGNIRDGGQMYDQSIGALALGEAHYVTGDEEYSQPLRRAAEYLIKTQNPKTGGWRYQPYPHLKSDPSDLSVSGWVIMALRSAEMSGSKRMSDDTLFKTRKYLDSVSAGKHKGKYGYRTPSPKDTMTAVGMYCQQILAIRRATIEDRQNESAAYLDSHLPNKRQKNYYYWYYGTLATFLHEGDKGEVWKKWNEKMVPIFLEKQQADGSWKAEGSRAKKEGTLVTTCWAALSLTVYYRYLPMYNGFRRMNLGKKPTAKRDIKSTPRINLTPKTLPEKK